jgi:hypothetical protein
MALRLEEYGWKKFGNIVGEWATSESSVGDCQSSGIKKTHAGKDARVESHSTPERSVKNLRN